MTKGLGWIALAACAMVAAAGSARADSRDEKIERLEREIRKLQDAVEELKTERHEAPPAAAAAPSASAGKDETSTAEGVASAVAERVKIGGYGSMRFEHGSADGVYDTFTLRRFVLTADAQVAPKLRFYFELEFERFRKLELERGVAFEDGGIVAEQEIEGTNGSEISLEQIWLEYAFANSLRAQMGALLVPLGRFNINHDDNRWDLPRRSLIDRGAPVLPVKAAWDELGVGVIGDIEVGEGSALSYRLAVVNGAVLEPEVEEVLRISEPDRDLLAMEAKFVPQTGTFGNDVKDDKAFTGRLAFSPALGHELAGSFYYGRYTPDFLPDEAISAFGVDGLTTWGPFELEGEFLYADYGDVDRVAAGFARSVVDKESSIPDVTSPAFEAAVEFPLEDLADDRYGYWIEPRLRFHPAWLREDVLGGTFEDPTLTAVLRWEQSWIEGQLDELEFEGGAVAAIEKADRRVDRLTIGGAFRPVPLVAFQLAYEFTKSDNGGLADVTNFIASDEDEQHAILLGATFGF